MQKYFEYTDSTFAWPSKNRTRTEQKAEKSPSWSYPTEGFSTKYSPELFSSLGFAVIPKPLLRSLVSRKVLHDCVQKCLGTLNIWGTLGNFFFSLSGRQVVGQKFR